MRRLVIGAAAVALVVATAGLLPIGDKVALAQDNAPVATFRYSGMSLGVGVDGSWGQGTLQFEGRDYPFHMHGLDLATIGVSPVTAMGDVYNLKSINDFSGTYVAATAGATVASGVSGTVMRNDRGVLIRMSSPAEGVQVKVAFKGATVELEEQSE